MGADGLRVVKFSINHILNGTPKEIGKALNDLMDLIHSLPEGMGDQRAPGWHPGELPNC